METIFYPGENFFDHAYEAIQNGQPFVVQVKGPIVNKLKKTKIWGKDFRELAEGPPSKIKKFFLFWKCLRLSVFWSIYTYAKDKNMQTYWEEKNEEIFVSFYPTKEG